MTTANQSAAERNITLVSVANIQPSNYNPRKRFDALLQTQTVTRLSLANADTVLPLLLVWKKFRLSYPNFRTKKHRKWRSQRTCSVKTLLLRKKPMLISNSLIVGGIR